MRPQDARKIVRAAIRHGDPRKALALVRKAEQATGERLIDLRAAIGRKIVDQVKLGAF